MSETKRKEKQTNKSLLYIWILRIIRGGDSNPTNFVFRRCLRLFSFKVRSCPHLGLRRETRERRLQLHFFQPSFLKN